LDDVWFWREERFIDIDLGVDVDGVVSDIKELDDFRFGELFDDTFTACKFFLKLAGVLCS